MSGKAGKLRVAFVDTHPIQYFAPLYAYLNRSADLAITALYLSDFSIRGAPDRGFGRSVKWDLDLLSGYEVRFVGGAERRNEPSGFFSIAAPAVWREVRAGAFDALVVHGHTPIAMLIAAAAAKRSAIPVFLRCDTHLGLSRSRLKALLRRPLIGALYGRFDRVLAIGSANRAFYRALGIADTRIFSMPYTVDNRRFMAAARLSAAQRQRLRASWGVFDDRPVVLYSAKFRRQKRPDDLVRAATLLRREGRGFHLVMVGSGEMEAELRTLAAELSLDAVHFTGFVNQSVLPHHYAASDIFVLPSTNEAWGLAVNEAMCAGLPIVASSELGCVPDLIRHGANGHTFTATKIPQLADALRPLLASPELRRSMGRASRDIISYWSYAECEAGLRAALASMGRGAAHPRAAPAAVAT
jgi:glycosyltransferase involved in cell wall biosynthesis